MSQLKFNPSSVSKPGTYRWFQSKHRRVNRIVDLTTNGLGTLVTKGTYKDLCDEIEVVLRLSRTTKR